MNWFHGKSMFLAEALKATLHEAYGMGLILVVFTAWVALALSIGFVAGQALAQIDRQALRRRKWPIRN